MDAFFRELLNTLSRIAALVVEPSSRTYWLYLLLTLLLAIAVVGFSRAADAGSRRFDLRATVSVLFDRAVWLHPSAITDYWCYVINAIFASIMKMTGLLSGAFTSLLFYALLLELSGGEPLGLPAGTSTLAAYTLLSLLWLDLGSYVGHYLVHRVPLLWEFHKVHHSAQVLTPVTLFRVHPCDLMFNDFVKGMFFGASGAMGLFVFGSQVQPLSILELNVGIFLFNVLGANLRHSHVWLPYPAWLSRILLSPAQHQIHHSSLPQHHNANLGLMFGVWDWMFGTLYVPKSRETLRFGLVDGEDRDYQLIERLYFVPLKKAWARLLGRSSAQPDQGQVLP